MAITVTADSLYQLKQQLELTEAKADIRIDFVRGDYHWGECGQGYIVRMPSERVPYEFPDAKSAAAYITKWLKEHEKMVLDRVENKVKGQK